MPNPLSPLNMSSEFDREKVAELVTKFNDKLLGENKDAEYYHVVISGEYPRVILDEVQKAFSNAGWHHVRCRTSSENGERGGLTGLQLYRHE